MVTLGSGTNPDYVFCSRFTVMRGPSCGRKKKLFCAGLLSTDGRSMLICSTERVAPH